MTCSKFSAEKPHGGFDPHTDLVSAEAVWRDLPRPKREGTAILCRPSRKEGLLSMNLTRHEVCPPDDVPAEHGAACFFVKTQANVI